MNLPLALPFGCDPYLAFGHFPFGYSTPPLLVAQNGVRTTLYTRLGHLLADHSHNATSCRNYSLLLYHGIPKGMGFRPVIFGKRLHRVVQWVVWFRKFAPEPAFLLCKRWEVPRLCQKVSYCNWLSATINSPPPWFRSIIYPKKIAGIASHTECLFFLNQNGTQLNFFLKTASFLLFFLLLGDNRFWVNSSCHKQGINYFVEIG